MVLVLARDLVAFGAQFVGNAHVKVVDDVPQTVVDHGILKLPRTHAVAETGLFQVVGRPAHALHAAGHHHLGIPHLDGLGRQHDRLQGRPADLVDRDGLDLPGHAGLDRGLLGRVLAVAAGQHLAHDHFVDGTFVDPGPGHGLTDHDATQVRGADAGQGSVETAQRRSDRADDDGFLHHISPQVYLFFEAITYCADIAPPHHKAPR